MNILSVFDGGINNRTNFGVSVSPLARCVSELTGNFGFDFHHAQGSFSAVVIWGDIWMGKKGEDAFPVFLSTG
jgi:hypothetical protein